MLACGMNNWTIALLIVASAFTVCTVAVCVLLAKLPPGSTMTFGPADREDDD